jgi:hypothetical protein
MPNSARWRPTCAAMAEATVQKVGQYTILDDIGDIAGSSVLWGAKQAVIAGHDVGAATAW